MHFLCPKEDEMREEVSQPPAKPRKIEDAHAIGYLRSLLRNRVQSILSNCVAKDGNHLFHRLDMIATKGDVSSPGVQNMVKKAVMLA
eukprot:245730-Pyramimonas_sp.AAC.1